MNPPHDICHETDLKAKNDNQRPRVDAHLVIDEQIGHDGDHHEQVEEG